MSRQDFQFLADALCSAPIDEEPKIKMVHHFSMVLKAAYPNFDPEKFWLRAVKE